MARDPDRPDLRRAWRRASEHRERTGDGSDAVLARFLALEGIDLLDGPARDAVLASWRRGDSFRAFQRVALRLVGHAVVEVGKAYWAIYRSFRGSGSPALDFVPTSAASLARAMQASQPDADGLDLRVVDVSLVRGDEDDSFDVLLAGRVIGLARTERGTPTAGPATLYLQIGDGEPDPDASWIDQG